MAPMAMHVAALGHTTWVIEEGLDGGNSEVSAPPGAPYRKSAPVEAPDVPVPLIRHLSEVGQTIWPSDVTVVLVNVSGAHGTAAARPPTPARPDRTIGPLAPPLTVPVPTAMQAVRRAEVQLSWVSAVAVKEVGPVLGVVHDDQLPAVDGPEMTMGAPIVVVVAMATQPLAVAGHTRLDNEVRLAGSPSAVQLSAAAVPPIDPESTTTAPVLVVPVTTHWEAEGQATWFNMALATLRLATAGSVSAVMVGEAPVVAWRITVPPEP